MGRLIDRFSQFPRALATQARATRLAGVPALLAHPEWQRPAPFVLWMHGRTASKEVDPGRYLRWIRSGIAACAIDLPGHGERAELGWDAPARTPDVLARVGQEIDAVLGALREPPFAGLFDERHAAIGGMSAGGMAALRRLCDPHPFRCAAVEATCGDLGALYAPGRWPIAHDPAPIAALDPSAHLDGFRPIPLLVLHTETDRVVPVDLQQSFIDRLRRRYQLAGADPGLIEVRLWRNTGAPEEHAGFGRFANEAKNAQVEFLARHLVENG